METQYYKSGQIKLEYHLDKNNNGVMRRWYEKPRDIKIQRSGNKIKITTKLGDGGTFTLDTTNEGEYTKDLFLEEICEIKNGKRHGVYKTYYMNGSIKSEGTFSNGLHNGLFKYYSNNGIYMEREYADGQRHGVFKKWQDGSLVRECFYLDGKREGLYQEWYPNESPWYNRIEQERIYKDGEIVELKKWDWYGKPVQNPTLDKYEKEREEIEKLSTKITGKLLRLNRKMEEQEKTRNHSENQ